MSKSRRGTDDPRPKPKVEHRSHRRNVKLRLKAERYENLPEVPRAVSSHDDRERSEPAT